MTMCSSDSDLVLKILGVMTASLQQCSALVHDSGCFCCHSEGSLESHSWTAASMPPQKVHVLLRHLPPCADFEHLSSMQHDPKSSHCRTSTTRAPAVALLASSMLLYSRCCTTVTDCAWHLLLLRCKGEMTNDSSLRALSAAASNSSAKLLKGGCCANARGAGLQRHCQNAHQAKCMQTMMHCVPVVCC
eukprot:1434112-Amphidinium_carterae.1